MSAWLLVVALLAGDPLGAAWAALRQGDVQRAEALYARAAHEDPQREEAWLGLQLAHVRARHWRAAIEAGERVLALDPHNVWAWRRLAWSHYNLGQWAEARAAYARALELDPSDGEMALGLGLSALKLGAWDEAQQACRRARRVLGDDRRVRACLEAVARRRVVPFASASASWWVYTRPWNLLDVRALTAVGGAKWPLRGALWAGASASQSLLDYSARDYRQLTAAAGGRLALGGRVGATLSGSWTWASHDAYDGIAAMVAGVDGSWGAWLAAGEVAASRWPAGRWVLQAVARAAWWPTARLSVELEPTLTATVGWPRASRVLGSVRARVRWWVVPRLLLWGEGAVGRWQYRIEGGGLGVWTGDGRYVAEYRVGVSWRMVASLDGFVVWRHAFGDEQAGRPHAFQLLGLTAGVGWATW